MKEQFAGFHLDFIGFMASLICAIHCAGVPLLLTLMPLMGLSFLENPWIEYSMILLSLVIAFFALLRGYRKFHKRPTALIVACVGFVLIGLGRVIHAEISEIAFTSLGAIAISVAHFINWEHLRKVLVY